MIQEVAATIIIHTTKCRLDCNDSYSGVSLQDMIRTVHFPQNLGYTSAQWQKSIQKGIQYLSGWREVTLLMIRELLAKKHGIF